ETSIKWTHEWKGEKNHHRYYFTAFVHAFDNYIFLKPSGELRLTIRGAFPVFAYSQTDVIMTGISGISEWEISDRSLFVNKIHYVFDGDISSGKGLIYIPPLKVQSGFSHTFVKIPFLRELSVGGEIIYN